MAATADTSITVTPLCMCMHYSVAYNGYRMCALRISAAVFVAAMVALQYKMYLILQHGAHSCLQWAGCAGGL